MRPPLVAFVLIATTSIASADAKVDALVPGYQRESATCATQLGGVVKVADGAAKLQADPGGADDAALADDIGKLAAGRAIVEGYCGELTGVLDFIAASPGATYRSLEHELDARDNKIRRARAASKKALEGLEPVLHGLIPRINARVSSPAPPDHRAPTKFPSGHAIELPALPGSWRLSGSTTTDTADYADKALTASVWTHVFAAATCEQQRRTLPHDHVPDRVIERELGEPAKQLGVAWSASYGSPSTEAHAARVTIVACLPSKTGGWMATAELTSTTATTAPAAVVDELAALMIRMLAAASAAPAP